MSTLANMWTGYSGQESVYYAVGQGGALGWPGLTNTLCAAASTSAACLFEFEYHANKLSWSIRNSQTGQYIKSGTKSDPNTRASSSCSAGSPDYDSGNCLWSISPADYQGTTYYTMRSSCCMSTYLIALGGTNGPPYVWDNGCCGSPSTCSQYAGGQCRWQLTLPSVPPPPPSSTPVLGQDPAGDDPAGTNIATIVGSLVGSLAAVVLLAFFIIVLRRSRVARLRHVKLEKAKQREVEEAKQREVREAEPAEADVALEKAQRLCRFWFVRAEVVRTAKAPLPAFQELHGRADAPLELHAITQQGAYRGEYARAYLAVSHRWLDPRQPDADGAQQRALQAYLNDHPEVEWVWFDYWCMPQGKRTPAQKVQFSWMLQNVNLLYLGAKVEILLDLSYISRFWTQFEAWLSMQSVTNGGLVPASREARRCHVTPILGANDLMVEGLMAMWTQRSPEEAHELLGNPDVTVTNAKDKEEQLGKLKSLTEEVMAVMAQGEAGGAQQAIEALPVRGSKGPTPPQAPPLDPGLTYLYSGHV